MVIDFIEEYAKLIVEHKDAIKVTLKEIDPTYCEITIFANKDDLGSLIGKGGNMINSLKTIVNACKAKDNISYKIQVEAL